MGYPLHLVDAFSVGSFTGNPAAVCLLPSPREEDWMQRVAMEMNQAETSFLVHEGDTYSLRWFTPTAEVDLCGHATLAAAHVLFSAGQAHGQVRFTTKSGILSAERAGDEIELDFPVEPPVARDLPFPLTWLDPAPVWTGANRMDWFVRLHSGDQIRNLKPLFAEIARLGARGLIATAPAETDGADAGYDFVSRCFYPSLGVDEDSATGSAHCALSPYWTAELGRSRLTGYQASQRGAAIKVELVGDRVKLRGHAVTTLAGELLA